METINVVMDVHCTAKQVDAVQDRIEEFFSSLPKHISKVTVTKPRKKYAKR